MLSTPCRSTRLAIQEPDSTHRGHKLLQPQALERRGIKRAREDVTNDLAMVYAIYALFNEFQLLCS